jgi:two-component system phosphate regulon sensor histidine kinase PhoR
MDPPQTRWFIPLVLAIAAIMGATAVLGYYSYLAGVRMEAKSEASLEQSNRLVGQKLIDRIEQVIIDSDRTLFRMVQLDDPREFAETWRRIVRASPVVQTVIVLDEDLDVVHLVSQLNQADLSRFSKLFFQRLVQAMDLPSLPPNAHRHLHRRVEGRPYLISYIRRQSANRNYYIALNIDLPYVTTNLVKEEFEELEDTNYIAILDEKRGVVYGQPAPGAGPFLFEDRFPTTLYRWRLQLAPREVGNLRQEAQTRRTLNTVLIVAADVLILLGMLTLVVAVRKERRANALKSEFISNVTHELKTPLSLIRMFGELLALGRTPSQQSSREYAEIITRESDRLARLIDNVLDFASIERGKAAYDFQPGDLATVLERAVDLVRHRVEQAGGSLQIHTDPDLPPVKMDENAITLMLLNLLENALKYGGADQPPEIQVTLGRAEEPQRLSLRVSDRGAGIPEEELDRVFERFYRGRAARGQPTRGSGIGLSLVRYIAEAHGGRVRVHSGGPGKGALFEVTIPTHEGGR